MAFVLKSKSEQEAASAARKASSLAGFNLDDLAGQGLAQLEHAKTEAQNVLRQAKAQAEQVLQQARQDGHAEGLKQAEKDVDARVKKEASALATQQVAAMKKATSELQQTYQDWMQQYASVLQQTILAAIEKIVVARVDSEKEVLLRWTAEALSKTRAATDLTVAVHPELLAELGQQLDELVAQSDLPERTTVVPDESLSMSDVVIRQSGGEIRAGLQAQLDRLAELLQ
ncbi:FliH/SctL family protein [Crateriforma conspicua]|uniref:FliH/SctL family protein n=1 Tax=Crateriforma conspicua TaxID=2527996 RepID=UPI0011899C62|nr:FliH/SctL family protein [Crateriforma conspicua]QDV65879.1 flagellar assembly protein H [Crateriforma conspicua]